MPYPDLGTMYQNGMGASASLLGGSMAANAQAQDAQKLQAMQLENQQSAVMNPLNAQFKQGQINQQGAELPGIQGQSASLVAKGGEDMALMSQKIAAKISSMSTQIGADGLAKMGQDADKMLHAASIAQQYPPAMQKQIFAKAVAAYGGDVNSPMFKGLGQLPDDKFLDAVNATGKGMVTASMKYQQESSMAKAHADSQERIAAGNNQASRDVADINGKSRLAAAQARAKAMVDSLGVDKAIAHYEMIPPSVRTDEDNQILTSLKTQQLQKAAAGANAVGANVMDMPNQMDAAAKAAAVAQQKRPGATNANAAQPIEARAKAQWPDYNPDVYEYRDVNGVVQRRKK